MKMLAFIFAFQLAFQAQAGSLRKEIQQLNQTYGKSKSYPILIIDKEDLHSTLGKIGVTNESRSEVRAVALAAYFEKRFQVKFTPEDVFEILPYVTGENRGASALPLFSDTVHHRMKACLVLPNESSGDGVKESRKLLGYDDSPKSFANVDVEKATHLLSIEQIELFSLYHELSHCLDEKYLPAMYDPEAGPYPVHLAESFAEVHALLMLYQSKNLKDLAYPRSLVRGLYSKYYGPHLANSQGSFFSDNLTVVRSGGSIYFLSRPLMAMQEWLEQHPQSTAMSLDQSTAVAQAIVDKYAFSNLGFTGLRMSFTDGQQNTLDHYKNMSEKAPKMFAGPYLELQEALSFLKSLDEKLLKFPSK